MVWMVPNPCGLLFNSVITAEILLGRKKESRDNF